MDASTEEKSSLLPYIFMFLTVLFWGVSWPIGKIATNEFESNVFTVAFIRFTIALPVLFILAKLLEGSISIPREFQFRVFILGLMQISLYNFLFLSGLRFTSSSDASLIIAINPTLTAVFSSFVYEDERLNPKRILGLILAFAGVFLIFLESPNPDVPNRILGNMLIFSGALVWSLYSTFSRPIYQKVSPLKFQVWATFYGWIILGLIAITEEPWNQEYSLIGVGSIVYLGLFAAALANTFFSYGVNKIGPTRTSNFVNLVPLIGILSSIIILSENFAFNYIVAFFLIISGVRIVNRS